MTDTQDEPTLTSGPWIQSYDVRTDQDFVDSHATEEPTLVADCERSPDARLIAVAGTAAHELPDEYDPVEAVEALPNGLERVRCAIIDLLDGPPGDTGEPAIRSAISRLVAFLDDAGNEEVSEIVDDMMLDAARGEA